MGKAIFTIDDSEWIFDDVTMEDLQEFIDIKSDTEDYESEENYESFEDTCRALKINPIAVENALVIALRKGYDKKKAELYLEHIL